MVQTALLKVTFMQYTQLIIRYLFIYLENLKSLTGQKCLNDVSVSNSISHVKLATVGYETKVV